MQNLPYVVLTEVLMTPFIVWLIGFIIKNAHTLTNRNYSLELILLTMMGSMLDALVYYLVTPPSFFSVVLAVSIAMLAMTAVIVYALWEITIKPIAKNLSRPKIIAFSLILVWNEVSMGVFLRVLAFPFSGTADLVNVLSYFGDAITSYLFLAPMIVEMLFFLIFSLNKVIEKRVAFSIFLMQIADPAMLGKSAEVIPLLIAYSIIMLFVIIFAFGYMYRKRVSFKKNDWKLFSLLILIIIISAIGLVMPAIVVRPFGLSWFVFALSMMVSMFIYFEIVLGLFSLPAGHPKRGQNVDSLISN
ncbi:MAG: hypothetical protein M1166_06080 [Candidatus Thermoplasmatota archaeon]|nr:hypothetical protein [Candidatus Thermoplasmatota archaeon]